MRRIFIAPIICGCCGIIPGYAIEEKPSLIFSGNSESELILNLDLYNRIIFDNDAMFVSHSDHPEDQIELFYSVFNRFEIGNANISKVTEIKEIVSEALEYDRSSNLLRLNGEGSNTYSVGIFNLNGTMICHTKLHPGESVSLEALEPSIYIAIAVCGDDIHEIKFIK